MKIATLVFITRMNNGFLEVLLGEKKKGEIGIGTLNGPGGKLDAGETLVECAVRETREELGIMLDPYLLEKVSVITFFAAGTPDFEVHIFLTSVFRGELSETDDMIPDWYRVDDMPYARMAGSEHEWFPKVITGEKFNANVYYKERAKNFERIEFLPFS